MEETTQQPQAGINPGDHLMNLKGKEYLPAAVRIAWFREQFPIDKGWAIRTSLIEGGREANYAIYRAEIIDPDGTVVQTATKHEDVQGFADYIEKAETGAISRALACCGFGTLQAQELDEGTERIHDTPHARKGGTAPQGRPTQQGAARPAAATQKPAQAAPKANPAPSSEEPPVPSEEGGETAPAPSTATEKPAAPAGGSKCVVCEKDLGKGRLGWCSAKNLPPHCPTCTLPKAEEN